MGPLVPVVAILVGGAAYKVHKDKKAKLTPKRKMILETAMNASLPPEKLSALADGFDKEGLKVEADLLRKRVNLMTAPAEQKAKWQDAFRKALASDKPDAIDRVADAFEKSGGTGSAAILRKHSENVKAGLVPPASPPPPFVAPPPAVAIVAPPIAPYTAPTVGPAGDLTSSMNQGQTEPVHPLDAAPPIPTLTQTGAPLGPSGLDLSHSTVPVSTSAAIAASITPTGIIPPVSPLGAPSLPSSSPAGGGGVGSPPSLDGASGGKTGVQATVSPIGGMGVTLPVSSPAGGGAVGKPPALGDAPMTSANSPVLDTVGHPDDATSSMNQK